MAKFPDRRWFEAFALLFGGRPHLTVVVDALPPRNLVRNAERRRPVLIGFDAWILANHTQARERVVVDADDERVSTVSDWRIGRGRAHATINPDCCIAEHSAISE